MKLFPFFAGYIFAADVCKDAAVSTCKFVIDEICGSNGKTYLNECVFQKAACFDEEDLSGFCKFQRHVLTLLVAYKGACCPSSCPTEIKEESPYKSTCGVLYPNDCEFYRQKCLLRRTFDIIIDSRNAPEGDLQTSLDNFENVRRFFGTGDCELPETWEELLEDFEDVFLEYDD